MKKVLIIFIMLVFVMFSNKLIKADHYRNFEELNITNGKLIDQYTSNELSSHYKEVDKRKFMGWKVKTINNRVKVSFISETIFTYYNDGYTPIDYNYKREDTETSKYSFSATGSIGLSQTSSKTGFKNGLDGSLKLSYSTDKTSSSKEVYEVKMKVDPGTQVNLYYYGEGYLTNGVAANYLFFIRNNRGGYEVFEMSSKYYKLEKVRIWKRIS